MSDPLIIGAGPAGIAAALTLVAAGLRPVLVDEAASCGGQIYRQPLIDDGRTAEARYGSEAAKATELHKTFKELLPDIDYQPDTLVWHLDRGEAELISNGICSRRAYQGLILATGATDRVLPLPGWTLPGVFSLGGAQIALKAQGMAIGQNVVFVGSGPLLYLVAWQYMRAGVRVAAVLDSAPLSAKRHLVPLLMHDPRPVLLGVKYASSLRLHGVKLHFGVRDVRFLGESRLEGVAWHNGHIACDGVGYGLGLRPETQLADLAGCAFTFSSRDRVYLPQRDAAGRTSVKDVYCAGDGAAIAGADAAALAGERAALALLQDLQLPIDDSRARMLEAQLCAIHRSREVLEAAFPFPDHWAMADDTILCRCENVTVGEAKSAMRAFYVSDINRLKAVSRVGMGRCQGRLCATGAAELLSRETSQPLDAVGRLRAQPPIKPIPFSLQEREP